MGATSAGVNGRAPYDDAKRWPFGTFCRDAMRWEGDGSGARARDGGRGGGTSHKLGRRGRDSRTPKKWCSVRSPPAPGLERKWDGAGRGGTERRIRRTRFRCSFPAAAAYFSPKNTGVPEMVAGFGFEAQSRRHQWEGWMGSWASCGLEVVDFFKKTSFPPLVNLIKEVIE